MLKKHAVLLVSTLELVPRPGIFSILDYQEMGLLLIGCELTAVPDPGQRLVSWMVLLLGAPHPLCTLPFF